MAPNSALAARVGVMARAQWGLLEWAVPDWWLIQPTPVRAGFATTQSEADVATSNQ